MWVGPYLIVCFLDPPSIKTALFNNQRPKVNLVCKLYEPFGQWKRSLASRKIISHAVLISVLFDCRIY